MVRWRHQGYYSLPWLLLTDSPSSTHPTDQAEQRLPEGAADLSFITNTTVPGAQEELELRGTWTGLLLTDGLIRVNKGLSPRGVERSPHWEIRPWNWGWRVVLCDPQTLYPQNSY